MAVARVASVDVLVGLVGLSAWPIPLVWSSVRRELESVGGGP